MGKVKNFFLKIGRWFKNHAPSKRRIIQLYAALLYNANLKGFISGRIFHGETKKVCVPGLNCYSCPGAVGSCPLGSLQNALSEANQSTPYYMLGILALFGVIFGRTICGFLCPIGLLQELLYKIKTPKIKKNKVTYILSFFKVVVLVVFVIAIPLGFGALGYANPGFCKYFCPAGTFGGGYMLLLNPNNASMFDMLGVLFSWKTLLLFIFILGSIFLYRFFCRFICPLGLIYGFFNYFSLLGVTVDRSKCTDCGLCVNACKVDIRKVGDHECVQCGKCIDVCPEQAITWKGSKFFLHKDQLEPVSSNIKIDLVSSLPKIDTTKEVETSIKPTEIKSEVSNKNIKTSKIEIEKIRYKLLKANSKYLNFAAKLEFLNSQVSFIEKELALPSKNTFGFRKLVANEISELNNSKPKEIVSSVFTDKQKEQAKIKSTKYKNFIDIYTKKQGELEIEIKDLISKLPEENRPSLETKPKSKRPLYDSKKTKVYFIVLFSFLTLLTGTALVYYNFIDTEVTSGEFQIGSIPENFELDLYNSDLTYTFDSQKFDDKLTVFNFWATWCGPCVAELPHFNEIQNEYKDDVSIIAIGDSNEDTLDVEKYINENFSTMTLTFAKDGEDNEVFRKFGGKDSLPYTVVLNKLNECVFMKEGKVSYEELKSVITSNL